MRLLARAVFCFVLSILTFAAKSYAEEGRPETTKIDTYKPMDALIGNPYTKIDVSFKAQVFAQEGVYFGYTQVMMWKVLQENAYFEDINYSPELFYRMYMPSLTHWIDFGAFQHESNGTGFDHERSWNRSYLRYHSENVMSGHTKLFWSVTGWVPYDYQKHNDDIVRYRGLYELNATLSGFFGDKFDIGDITLRVFPGGPSGLDITRGGQELSFRIKPNGVKILPPIVLQIFNGYGENLLDYKTRHFEFRAGIGF